MKIKEVKNECLNLKVDTVDSGTVVEYGDELLNPYGYGIVMNDCDKEDCVIFDIADNIYYSDIDNYRILRIFENSFITIS